MEEPIRIFIAIKLSSQVRDSLTLVAQQIIRRGIKCVRWVKPENIHLTIRFLGDISNGKVGDIVHVIGEAVKICSPFTLRFGGIGAFPNHRKPQVVWVGVDSSLELLDLHSKIERRLYQAGFQGDNKGLRPHLTIGRLRRELSHYDLKMIADLVMNNEFPTVGEQVVESIHLIKSELRSEGPTYSFLASVKLGEGYCVE